MSRIVQYMDETNAYYKKMFKTYREQFETLHSKTVENVLKNETLHR